MNTRFILESYVTGGRNRYTCPNCGGKKQFARYKDKEGKVQFPDFVGRCNRENACGYHCTPKQFLENNPDFSRTNKMYSVPFPTIQPEPEIKPDTISKELVAKTYNPNYPNHFLQYLKACFGMDLTNYLQSIYCIGTSKKWEGACIFWQLDTEGFARTGKIMLYHPDTGKRVKEGGDKINWVHSQYPNFKLSQVLFGLNLLNLKEFQGLPVSIVESESCAITMQALSLTGAIEPEIWLATGGSAGCGFKPETLRPLIGRKVTLYPDLGFFDKWKAKTDVFKQLGIEVFVSGFLEQNAPTQDKEIGNFDLRDYLISEKRENGNGFVLSKLNYPLFWDFRAC